MAFYSAASNASLWRGVDYYETGKVVDFSKSGERTISGTVEGSEGNRYSVDIDLDHPKRSTCTCPFAAGRQVVCKHMVALYFASTPGSYERLLKDVEEAETLHQLQEERWKEETRDAIEEAVSKLSEKGAKERLADMMYRDALEDRYGFDDYWR